MGGRPSTRSAVEDRCRRRAPALAVHRRATAPRRRYFPRTARTRGQVRVSIRERRTERHALGESTFLLGGGPWRRPPALPREPGWRWRRPPRRASPPPKLPLRGRPPATPAPPRRHPGP